MCVHSIFNTKPIKTNLSTYLVGLTLKTKYRLWVRKYGNLFPEVKADNTTQGTRENFGSWGPKLFYIF